MTKTFTSTGDKAAVAAIAASDGIVQIYGVDEIQEVNSAKHLNTGKYPFAGVLKKGATDYATQANVAGCENCHTQPFLKHTYIYGTVKENVTGATTEFYTCKGCHYDDRAGHDLNWQIEKDDPARAAEIAAGSAITAAETTKYAYKAKLMNDVHMSHAMEFAYPQSMKNCVTCHENKMDETTGIFKQANFNAETCISCHSVDGIKAKMAAAAYTHGGLVDNLTTTDCTACHKPTGGAAPSFKTIHGGGYDSKIYSTAGVRYSTTFVVSTPTVTIANNVLDIKFSATGTLGSLSAADITPTVLVGLYGYNSKDFIVSPHSRDADRVRLLEFKIGDTNPRFTTVTAAGGNWEVTADLSLWADWIADGTVKRAEIAVLPELKDAAGTVLGLNAPSVTFNLDGVTDDSGYFSDIVKVAKTTGTDGKITGCNTCHDQLATTFHSGIRGGNIKVCRLCHTVANGGSHLELQSRSIDSYVHAIHTFQAFDIGDVDFADAVEAAEYEHHVETSFPRFGILNCESCHNAGKYDVPDQSKSMPGVLSGSDAVAGRNIGTIPAAVTGPATRACGGCHRAQKINEDDAGGLLNLIQHWKQNGYVLDYVDTLWEATVAAIMGNFK
jgi:OmcA/MtrC family decaheme c-type cytochrome